MHTLPHPHLSPASQMEKTPSTQLENDNKQHLLPSHKCSTMQAQLLTNPQDFKTHFQAPRRSNLNCKTSFNVNTATTIFIPQESIVALFLKSATSPTPYQSIYKQTLQNPHCHCSPSRNQLSSTNHSSCHRSSADTQYPLPLILTFYCLVDRHIANASRTLCI
jgi:hypothetical protein